MRRTETLTIEAADVGGMVRHWLSCPAGSYLGQDYGCPALDMLHSPMAGLAVDGMIAKMREDISLVGRAPVDSVSAYSVSNGVDSARIVLDVAGHVIALGA